MCFCILKYLFICVNVILIKLGLGIVAAGVVMIVALNNTELEAIQNIGVFIIVFGVIFTAIFFFGCCGAVTKNNCLLITYSIIIFFLITSTIAGTVLYSNNMTDIKDLMVKDIADSNNVQIWEPLLKCCGTTGPDSYEGVIPITCCPDFDINNLDASQIGGSLDDLNIFTCDRTKAYKRGCQKAAAEYVQYYMDIILNILYCIVVAQVLMLLIAISLISEYRRHRRKNIY